MTETVKTVKDYLWEISNAHTTVVRRGKLLAQAIKEKASSQEKLELARLIVHFARKEKSYTAKLKYFLVWDIGTSWDRADTSAYLDKMRNFSGNSPQETKFYATFQEYCDYPEYYEEDFEEE